MLKNYVPLKVRYRTDHYLSFYYDDDGNGFSFPCDAAGNVLPLEYKEAKENLDYCLAHPEKFAVWNEVEHEKVRDDVLAHGTCSCGQEVELYDQYYGACQCPNCGRWYNLFGQELLPPEYWVTDPSEEEYW